MAFTSKDVARLAGVSQSTVSYVMNGNRPISADTRQRVLAAIEELTYQPNAGARALASQRTRVIGLVAPFGSGDTTGLRFIETITATARQHDHDVLLVTADEGAAGLVRLAQRSLVDAIVLMEIGEQDPRVEVAAGLGIPVVLVGIPEDTHGLPCVDLDFEHAAALAVDDLARQHTERLVMLGHPAELAATGINYIGRFYRSAGQAAARHDLSLQIVVPAGSTRSAVSDSLLPALEGSGRTGLLLPHFAAVPAALSALAWAEIAVPDRVAAIALCTDSTAEATDPPVSNVSLEPRDVSRRAMAILFAQLDGTPRPRQPAAAHQPVPHQTVPHETVPHETVPHETVPHESDSPDGVDRQRSTPDIELVTPRLTHRGTTRP